MSSRVRECIVPASFRGVFNYSTTEKGGTFFRPVVNQRRPASELSSKPGSSSSAVLHLSEASNAMPPPSSVPQRLETPASSLASEQQDVDESQARRSSPAPQRVIPNVVSNKVSTPITVGSSRRPATPISIGSRSSSIPIPPSPAPRPVSVPSRSTDVHPFSETNLCGSLPLETADNYATQNPRTPPPEPSSP